MKLLNELRLRLDNPKWVLDADLAVIDTILDENPRLYEIVGADLLELNKSSKRGRQDSPTVEQVVRAALYTRRSRSWIIVSLNMRRKILGYVACSSNWRGGHLFPLRCFTNIYPGSKGRVYRP